MQGSVAASVSQRQMGWPDMYVDVLVGGELMAHGEVVTIGDKCGVRITRVVSG